jgi:Putative peptidoglycan binding domain
LPRERPGAEGPPFSLEFRRFFGCGSAKKAGTGDAFQEGMCKHRWLSIFVLCGALGGSALAQDQSPVAALDGEKPVISLEGANLQPAPPPAAPKITHTTWTGAEIRTTQEHLASAGYLKRRPSTRWNRPAIRALREWQVAQGLEPTGKLSDEVWAFMVQSE